MPHPKDGYRLKDGTRVPGVTTILSMMKGDPTPLMHWAWKLGTEGKDYRAERDRAAGIGTIAHALIDAHLLGKPEPELKAEDYGATEEAFSAMVGKARVAFGAYLEWRKGRAIEIVASEVSIVSEGYRFGGTPDLIAILNGNLVILDWKASNRIYPEYIAQVAAYRHLWFTHSGYEPSEAHLLRVGKDEGDFHYHYWPRSILDKGTKAFLCCLELYDLKKDLTKVL